MLAHIIGALKNLQMQVAQEALAKPREVSAAEYGRQVGRYEGVGLALEIIEGVLNDADDEKKKQELDL